MTAREGELSIEGDRAVLRFERRLPYPVDAVWSALTEPGHRDQWMGKTSIEPSQGGSITTVASGPPLPPDQKRMTGRILVWDPDGRGTRCGTGQSGCFISCSIVGTNSLTVGWMCMVREIAV
jgi:hypothetical protein